MNTILLLMRKSRSKHGFGDSGLGEWIYEQLGYRSYGSMYVNEKTPDGQWVDKNGKK